MADVVVPMPADGSPALPAVCVGCGRSATRYLRARVLGSSSGYARMFGEFALDNLEQMARGPGRIPLPVYWWHRWIMPLPVTVTAVKDGAGSRFQECPWSSPRR